jgi:LmbE family N-acetylglucosaminyl deacetylase
MHKFLLQNGVGAREEGGHNLLFLGAHADDIEIGCGGTVLRLLREYPVGHIWWVVFSADEERAEEARQSASVLLAGVERQHIEILSFADGFFPYSGPRIKEYFESLKNLVSPDVIFTHYRNDLHQDHRLVSELTWNTFRDHLILEYEVLKYDGDLGTPNLFVHLTPEACRQKVDHIRQQFGSQNGRHWFADDTFLSVLRLRGMESNAPGKFAEGFYCRKVVM